MIISKRSSTLLTGSVAGLIGGFVELGWVTLYGDITGADPHQLAPGIVSAAQERGVQVRYGASAPDGATSAARSAAPLVPALVAR